MVAMMVSRASSPRPATPSRRAVTGPDRTSVSCPNRLDTREPAEALLRTRHRLRNLGSYGNRGADWYGRTVSATRAAMQPRGWSCRSDRKAYPRGAWQRKGRHFALQLDSRPLRLRSQPLTATPSSSHHSCTRGVSDLVSVRFRCVRSMPHEESVGYRSKQRTYY